MNFKNLFLLYLWVLICVKVGNNDVNSKVKCQSSCFSENLGENGSVEPILSEKFGALKALGSNVRNGFSLNKISFLKNCNLG